MTKLPIQVQDILTILPHRYPFVMVDRVTDVVPGERIVGHKCVAYNEPWFPGHFPTHPIMPGVLIIEAMVQIGGILAYASEPLDMTNKGLGAQSAEGDSKPQMFNKVVLFLGIDKARFRRPVVPGDKLDLTARVLHRRGPVWKLAGEATVDGQRCAEAEMLAQIADRVGP